MYTKFRENCKRYFQQKSLIKIGNPLRKGQEMNLIDRSTDRLPTVNIKFQLVCCCYFVHFQNEITTNLIFL